MALIPVRWIISLLGIYAAALVYTQRAGMSVAIVAMTTHSKSSQTPVNLTHECAEHDGSAKVYGTSPVHAALLDNAETKPEFEWNEKLQVCCPGVTKLT